MLVESCGPPWLADRLCGNASSACIGTMCTMCAKPSAGICIAAAAHSVHCRLLQECLIVCKALLQLHALAAQVECPSVTPEVVLKASGHVDRFTDFMVTDAVTHDCHRADHLLEAALEARLADAKAPPSAEEREVRPGCAINAQRCRLRQCHQNPNVNCFLLERSVRHIVACWRLR